MLSHLAKAEQAWFQRIYGQEVDREVFEILPIERIRALQLRHAGLYSEVLESDLGVRISYARFNGEAHVSAVSDILLHLCTHGSHHRGQMAAHCAKLNYAALNTDYINYTRLRVQAPDLNAALKSRFAIENSPIAPSL